MIATRAKSNAARHQAKDRVTRSHHPTGVQAAEPCPNRAQCSSGATPTRQNSPYARYRFVSTAAQGLPVLARRRESRPLIATSPFVRPVDTLPYLVATSRGELPRQPNGRTVVQKLGTTLGLVSPRRLVAGDSEDVKAHRPWPHIRPAIAEPADECLVDFR